MTEKQLEKLRTQFIEAMSEANKKTIDEMNAIYEKFQEKYFNYENDFFIRDGQLKCTSENGHDTCDYYGEYRGGYPWVNPVLEKLADELGFFWEWDNAACISLCKC